MKVSIKENQSVIDEFNSFFEGDAKAIINGDRLEITIGTKTQIIALPKEIGGQSASKD